MGRKKKQRSIAWYGGKSAQVEEIIALIPPESMIFVDIFGGSGIIVINVGHVPVRVYNDINSIVTDDIFRTLRTHTQELMDALEWTPYGRREFDTARLFFKKERESGRRPEWESLTPAERVERGRMAFFLMAASRGGGGQRSPSWSYSIDNHRFGMSGAVAKFRTHLPEMAELAAELETIQLECLDFRRLIRLYDTPQTCFYADPPYDLKARKTGRRYDHEMTDQDHTELRDLLAKVQGTAVVSGYRSPLYDELYKGWERRQLTTVTTAGSGRNQRIECMWLNANLSNKTRQLPLFLTAPDTDQPQTTT